MNEGMLILHDLSQPAIECGAKHFQRVMWIGGNPYKIHHARYNQQDPKQTDIPPFFPESVLQLSGL